MSSNRHLIIAILSQIEGGWWLHKHVQQARKLCCIALALPASRGRMDTFDFNTGMRVVYDARPTAGGHARNPNER